MFAATVFFSKGCPVAHDAFCSSSDFFFTTLANIIPDKRLVQGSFATDLCVPPNLVVEPSIVRQPVYSENSGISWFFPPFPFFTQDRRRIDGAWLQFLCPLHGRWSTPLSRLPFYGFFFLESTGKFQSVRIRVSSIISSSFFHNLLEARLLAADIWLSVSVPPFFFLFFFFFFPRPLL